MYFNKVSIYLHLSHDDLTSELKTFWDYESFGIHDDNTTLYDKFVNEVEIVEGGYQVRLLFTLID